MEPRYFVRAEAARYIRKAWGLPCAWRWLGNWLALAAALSSERLGSVRFIPKPISMLGLNRASGRRNDLPPIFERALMPFAGQRDRMGYTTSPSLLGAGTELDCEACVGAARIEQLTSTLSDAVIEPGGGPVIGIDRNQTASLALRSASGDLLQVADMPVLPDELAGLPVINARHVVAMLSSWGPARAFIAYAEPIDGPVGSLSVLAQLV